MKTLINYARKNEKFNDAFEFYCSVGLISKFDDKLIDSFNDLSAAPELSVYNYFEQGMNIGSCHLTSIMISPLFDDFVIEKGHVDALDSLYKTHSWLVSDGYVYDTSLLIKFHESIKEEMGYYPKEVFTKKEINKEGTITNDVLGYVSMKK